MGYLLWNHEMLFANAECNFIFMNEIMIFSEERKNKPYSWITQLIINILSMIKKIS